MTDERELDVAVAQAMTEMQPETPQPQVEAQPIEVQPTQSVQPKPSESFREIREQLERERLRNMEIEERLRRQEEMLRAQTQQQPQEEHEYTVADDAILEGKDFNKLNKQQKRAREEDRRRYDEELQKTQAMVIEQRLMLEHPDYLQVMTSENLAKLERTKPHLARAIMSTKDPYDMRKTTFEAIKDYVIKEENKELELKAQQEKIAKNQARAIPTTSGVANPSGSPLTKAHAYATGLTDERKKEIWEEAAKQYGKYYNYK